VLFLEASSLLYKVLESPVVCVCAREGWETSEMRRPIFILFYNVCSRIQ
jgi:hypothetical protein